MALLPFLLVDERVAGMVVVEVVVVVVGWWKWWWWWLWS